MIIIFGVSGVGKTTVGKLLARELAQKLRPKREKRI